MSTNCFSCCFNPSRQRRRHYRLPEQDTEDDYFLPPTSSVQWDRPSKSFINKKKRGQSSSYVPPSIPSSSSSPSPLPTIEEFQLLRTLGKGAFGKVFLAAHSPSSSNRSGSMRTLYALKVIPKMKLTTEKLTQQVMSEIDILKKIKHPFCLSLQFTFQNNQFLFYVMEFAAGGMLFYHLREESRFSESRARFYIGEIILALEYIHNLGIIFRDLKPENCMLNALGHIVITDFGSATTLHDGEASTTIAGTPQYMAPEVLSGGQYNCSADWWSCGVLLYEMLTGKTPFHSNNRVELYRAVLRGNFNIPFYISHRAKSILYRLIERDPSIRGGGASEGGVSIADNIKQHSFFSPLLMDAEEEAEHIMEERERLDRIRSTAASANSSSPSMGAAGKIVRKLSHSAAHFAGSMSSIRGTACEWNWKQLKEGTVTPPFIPKLSTPTDCRYFDPVITSLLPTFDDLSTATPNYETNTMEGFDYNRLQGPSPSPSSPSPSPPLDNDGSTSNSRQNVVTVSAEIH